MNPQIVEKPEMILAGIVGTGKSVSDLDIHSQWIKFEKAAEDLKHQVPDVGYEVHIEKESEPKMHFCFTGVEVKAKVSLNDEKQAKKIEEIAQLAEKYCLVSGSVACPVEYQVEVVDNQNL